MRLFCCYSPDVRDYLMNNGLRYILCAKNPNSDAMFWAFERDEKLNMLLGAKNKENKK